MKRRTEMGKVVVSENVTLDGVIQDPAGVEGFSLGGWVGRIGGQGREEAAEVALDEALGAEAFLLGRRSYEFLAARWPSRSGPLAERLNGLPKEVERPAQVRSVLDPRSACVEQHDGVEGRRGRRGLEVEAADRRGNRGRRQLPALAHAPGARPG